MMKMNGLGRVGLYTSAGQIAVMNRGLTIQHAVHGMTTNFVSYYKHLLPILQLNNESIGMKQYLC